MLKLYYPVKNPINQSNLFGANPAEYAPLGQKGHPGNDFECPTGTPIYAPCDGNAFYAIDSLGGNGIYIETTDDEGNNFNIILWHMPVPGDPAPPGVTSATDYPYQIPTDHTRVAVKAGQLLGYTDNSGYHPTGVSESSGPHLHLGVMAAGKLWDALDPTNGFLGCVDPTPFYNDKYAEDITTVQEITDRAAQAVQIISSLPATQASNEQKVGWLEALENLAKEISNFI